MAKKAIVLVIMAILLPIAAMNVVANNPPEKPTITGPTSGEAGKTYTYTIVTTDPDGDKVKYCINWGDGNEFCTDYVKSGEEVQIQHSWQDKGSYTITVTATDEHEAESQPATLKVSMPLSYPFERFKIIKPRNGLYIFGIKMMPMIGQIVIGNINAVVKAPSYVNRVEFFLLLTCGCGLEKTFVDTEPPFKWKWNVDYDDNEVKDKGLTWLFARGYDSEWHQLEDSIILYKI